LAILVGGQSLLLHFFVGRYVQPFVFVAPYLTPLPALLEGRQSPYLLLGHGLLAQKIYGTDLSIYLVPSTASSNSKHFLRLPLPQCTEPSSGRLS
jgi:hypothetical protein